MTCIHWDDAFGLLTVHTTDTPEEFRLSYEGWEIVFKLHQPGYRIIHRGSLPDFYFEERIAQPFIKLLNGAVCLHAGAIATPRGILLMLAPTCIGKSTITASALAFSSAKLVSDDMVCIEGSYPACIRIGSHHIAMRHETFSNETFVTQTSEIHGKTILHVAPDACLDAPMPVSAMLLLQKAEKPEITPIPYDAALPALLAQQLILSNPTMDFKRDQFKAIIEATRDIPVFQYAINTESRVGCRQSICCLCDYFNA